MTETAETVAGVGSLGRTIKKVPSPADAERAAIRELVVAARARGEDLTGPDGLLKLLTKTVLETALEEEMTEHLGYDKLRRIGEQGHRLADHRRRAGGHAGVDIAATAAALRRG